MCLHFLPHVSSYTALRDSATVQVYLPGAADVLPAVLFASCAVHAVSAVSLRTGAPSEPDARGARFGSADSADAPRVPTPSLSTLRSSPVASAATRVLSSSSSLFPGSAAL